MAVSVTDVLNDAKKLANRIKKYDASTDNLLGKAANLEKSVEAMKDYHAEMENLSNVYGPISRSSLIMTIQRESKQLQALERENKELRIALEDHQNALELIMSKYRLQVSQLIQLRQRDFLERNNRNDIGSRETIFESELIQAHSNKVLEMASVMRKAIEIDEENDCQQKMILSQLRTENQGLREMLAVAKKSGSISLSETDQRTIQRRPVRVSIAEKEVQTDDDLKSNYQNSPKIDEASEVTE